MPTANNIMRLSDGPGSAHDCSVRSLFMSHFSFVAQYPACNGHKVIKIMTIITCFSIKYKQMGISSSIAAHTTTYILIIRGEYCIIDVVMSAEGYCHQIWFEFFWFVDPFYPVNSFVWILFHVFLWIQRISFILLLTDSKMCVEGFPLFIWYLDFWKSDHYQDR